MDCETAYNLISARIDGELLPAEGASLDAHLAQCPGCRGTLEAMQSQDALLAEAFEPRRQAAIAVAEAAIRQIHAPASRAQWRMPWLPMLLSAAAGFVVALVIFRHGYPTPTPQSGVNPQEPGVGHLALATGLIEVLPPGQTQWEAMPTGGKVVPNSRIRTGLNVRCEIAMGDGSQVRLNSNSELMVCEQRKFALDQGEMFSTVSPASIPFQVLLAEASVTALGTEFDLQRRPDKAFLSVLEGSMQVNGKTTQATVKTGERISIVDGEPTAKQTDYYLILATRWVNELLMMKGRDNAELNRRVNELFARIGAEKMESLYEQEIRSLGDHCVIPLTRYVQSDLSHTPNAHSRRIKAAQILSDMAQPWSIGDLIPMLKDPDPDVRYYAARALRRLNGGWDFGCAPEEWRDNSPATAKAYRGWQEWWAENKSRIPQPPTTMPIR